MNARVLQVAMFLLFAAVHSVMAQHECPGLTLNQKPFVDGFRGTDSLTVEQILKAGKIATPVKGWEIINFTIFFGGNCLGEGLSMEFICPSDTFTAETIRFFRKLGPGSKFYIGPVQIKTKGGQLFCLPIIPIHIKQG